MAEPPQIEVHDDPAGGRYTVVVDGHDVGGAYYVLARSRVVFTHTEVDPRYEGRGVGSALVRGALDDVRRQGKVVIAQCPFIAGYIRRHPEYADLTSRP